MTSKDANTPSLNKNRLQHEKSPYLLQHEHNPVDWFPWGDEAFARAQKDNKPIFLSIGYATCHWCHVMEHESFEDQAVADLLNRDYICIKVDREERPDIDQVYMDVCTRTTGSGGWPLTIFMTPDKQPFFAGTYFPKESRMNRPGLIDYLPLIAARWQEKPEELLDRAQQIISALQEDIINDAQHISVKVDIFTRTTEQLVKKFDLLYGGFGEAPKFPSPHNLAYLLRRHRHTGNEKLLQIVKQTLHNMRQGGLFDQVGFGFHRYSTDREWLVPHFEKMLYDQAGMASVYLEAYQVTNDETFAQTAREIFSYVLRDLTGEHGGFFSAQDADSDGEEGLFYLWSKEEMRAVLGDEAGDNFCEIFNVTSSGNYLDEMTQQKTGKNIPHLTNNLEQVAKAKDISVTQLEKQIEENRVKLFTNRRLRIPPITDDKVLTAWNGMMISSLAEGGRILDNPTYITAAESAADFILTTLRDPEGRLLRRYREGDAAIDAFAEDYAFLAKGLLDLYRATFKPERLQQAIELTEQMTTMFFDSQSGLLYETTDTNRELIVRPKNLFDGAHPSTNSIGLQLFARLNLLTGEPLWRDRGEALLLGLSPYLKSYPAGFTCALQGAALLLEPTREMVMAGNQKSTEMNNMIQVINQIFAPETEVIQIENAENGTITKLAPFTQHMSRPKMPAAAYVCQNFSCQKPITKAEELATLLKSAPDQV